MPPPEPNRPTLKRWQRGVVLVSGAHALLCVVLLAALTLRPALILGVGGGALDHSLAFELPHSREERKCQHQASGEWSCRVFYMPPGWSGGGYAVNYRLSADSFGCWKAWRLSPERTEARVEARSCIYLWDL